MKDYQCAECDAPASVEEGVIYRTCNHIGTVHAFRTATLYGQGGATDQKPSLSERISFALSKIANGLRGA